MLRQIPLFILEDCQRDWTTLSQSGNLCTLCFLPSHSWSHFPIFSMCFLELPFFKIIWPQIHVSRFAFEKSKPGHIQTLRQQAHRHTHTHLFIYFGDGGMKDSKMYFSIIGFPKFTICCVLSLKSHLIHITAKKKWSFISCFFFFLILWDSWFVLELTNKSMLYGHLFCI